MSTVLRVVSVALLGLAGSVCGAVTAQAGQVTVNLVRGSLNNVTDAAGATQYEGGTIQNTGGSAIGHYITTRRVTTSGVSADNTAGTTTTLFFPSGDSNQPPNSIVIEGAWSFNSGALDGSVSAASTYYHWIIGSVALETTSSGSTSLNLRWLGASPGLTVP